MSIWTSGCTPYQLVGDDEPAVASVAAPPEAPDDRYRATGVLEPRVPAGVRS